MPSQRLGTELFSVLQDESKAIFYLYRFSVFGIQCAEDLEAICTNSPGQLRQLGVSSADIKLLVPAFYRPGAVHTRRVDSVATPKNVITTNISEESPRSEETIGGDKLDDVGFESLVSLLRPLFSGGDDLKVVVLARALVSVGIKCKHDLVIMCTNSPGQLRQLGVSSDDMKLLVPAFYRPEAVQSRYRNGDSVIDSVARRPKNDGTLTGMEKSDGVLIESLVQLLRPLFSGNGDEGRAIVYARALASVGIRCREDLVTMCTNSPGQLRQLGVSSDDMKLLVPAFYRPEAVQSRYRNGDSVIDSVARRPKNDETSTGMEKSDDVLIESLVQLLRPLFSGNGDEGRAIVYARALASVGIRCRDDLVIMCTNSPGQLRQLGVSSDDMKLLVPAFYRPEAVSNSYGKLAPVNMLVPAMTSVNSEPQKDVESELHELEVRFSEVYHKTAEEFDDHNPLKTLVVAQNLLS